MQIWKSILRNELFEDCNDMQLKLISFQTAEVKNMQIQKSVFYKTTSSKLVSLEIFAV